MDVGVVHLPSMPRHNNNPIAVPTRPARPCPHNMHAPAVSSSAMTTFGAASTQRPQADTIRKAHLKLHSTQHFNELKPEAFQSHVSTPEFSMHHPHLDEGIRRLTGSRLISFFFFPAQLKRRLTLVYACDCLFIEYPVHN